ncbi:MAG: hypothetical protein DWQ31_08750 [Planctomycetota bacterium]|nr:MAG: hypothetical protein DWQ31_08750 [Planctomycetota bacterium]REJ86922.1 MAG: hypothetical protein DWQ35_22420 [Planctomycetota bacterium]REK24951.1 MAG: hypothetical protein DWQ42_12750 [Planctomycetota bacterium]REK48540.1 MAG: hypothetical protein DWQ46_02280 [Planctomycetota bacterium]
MWRHGDVFIQSCDQVPEGAKKLPHLTLAKGEITGHAHRVLERDGNQLYEFGDSMFLLVGGPRATVTHEEHAPIELEPGAYRAWIQREYSPEAIRRVLD